MEHIIVNDDIRLEQVKVSMASIIFNAIDKNRDALKTWLPFVDMTLQLSDTQKFLQAVAGQSTTKKDEIYSIWFKEKFAGLIGFKETDWLNKKTELGYWLIPEMESNGIISLSVQKLIKYAFKKLKLNRVQIKVAIGNNKSSAVPKRLGFQLEGVERAGELIHNIFYDLETYSMLKREFLS